ncbi:MAG: Rrf2 family transcriptional regulator [Bacteroidota bacterium]|nr:Rrf2 family transcriptional regulator [Bacteroidota bacterium]
MLSKKTQYAIYALANLARNFGKGPIQIERISNEESIPRKFLEAILLDLRGTGMVNSKRGKGGGYYLLKHPQEINLADIYRHFEGPIALLPCVSEKYYEKCSQNKDEATCGVKSTLKEIRDKTVEILQKSTLEVIIGKKS